MTLFDFKTVESLDDWQEISDTVRSVGQSKAVLVLQKTQVFQRAIFFTLLNPQPNGAGFAGVRTLTQWDLSNFKDIAITCRGQGSNQSYKVILRHNGYQSNDDVSYEQFFTVFIIEFLKTIRVIYLPYLYIIILQVMMSNKNFATVTLPLENFKAYFRGKEVEDADPLNTSNVTMFGLQVYGGVYSDIKQKGVSALEIENIVAIS